MAKKKRYGSINLLKGIQGSKLAALVTVLVILLAIPLTVVMNQRQQQTKQEAATVPCPDKYGNAYGGCFDKTKYVCSKAYISDLCYGGSSIKCCQASLITFNRNKCVDVNSYMCNNGSFMIGYCQGGSNIRYCTGTPRYTSKVPCAQYINPDNGRSGYCSSRCSVSTTKGICSSGQLCCVY